MREDAFQFPFQFLRSKSDVFEIDTLAVRAGGEFFGVVGTVQASVGSALRPDEGAFAIRTTEHLLASLADGKDTRALAVHDEEYAFASCPCFPYVFDGEERKGRKVFFVAIEFEIGEDDVAAYLLAVEDVCAAYGYLLRIVFEKSLECRHWGNRDEIRVMEECEMLCDGSTFVSWHHIPLFVSVMTIEVEEHRPEVSKWGEECLAGADNDARLTIPNGFPISVVCPIGETTRDEGEE